MSIIVQLASSNEMIMGGEKRVYTKKALDQIVKLAKGIPVTLGVNGIEMGNVKDTWISDGNVYASINCETLNVKYVVPGFKIVTSKNGEISNIKFSSVALTDRPEDTSLKTIQELNDAN